MSQNARESSRIIASATIPAGEAGPGQLYLYCAACLSDTPDSNALQTANGCICALCGSTDTAFFYRHPEGGDGYYEWADAKVAAA